VGAVAGIVLAGGRSSRMGFAKAGLEWHGTTLLRRVAGIVARGVDGPIIVVRAPDQELPDLGADVEVVADALPGRGPLQGLAAGLAAVGDRAEAAYVSSTDVPLLHPAFVRHVARALDATSDVVLPVVHGHPQPLAAVYRTSVLPLVQGLLDADRLRPAFLYGRCRTQRLTEAALRRDPDLAALDPALRSVENLNEPADYVRARALSAPAIEVERLGGLAPRPDARRPAHRRMVHACTLGAAAGAVSLELDEHVAPTLNGDRIGCDLQLPLATGDRVAFWVAAEPPAASERTPGG
jgi:molybdopterin-guanine dinucleotide biosynthesis protein A